MMMYSRLIAVLGAVLAVAAFGGLFLLKASAVGPSTWSDRAQVTGYATSDVRGQTAGPVSVELNGALAARIDEIVQGLPPANLHELCARNSQEYRISFSASARQVFRLTGYWCHNLVVEQPARGPAVDRIDRYCALLAEVRQLLPASATATHSGTCLRASERLFLAASRHPSLHSFRPLTTPTSHHPRPLTIPTSHHPRSLTTPTSHHQDLGHPAL